jgi:hypothetical protein
MHDEIPDFLRRPMPVTTGIRRTAKRLALGKIPYPRDGYLGRGLRAAARARLRAARARHAERCRQR